jgi:hypothetical protein
VHFSHQTSFCLLNDGALWSLGNVKLPATYGTGTFLYNMLLPFLFTGLLCFKAQGQGMFGWCPH